MGQAGLPVAALGRARVVRSRLMAQRPFIVPIPGTTNVAHMEENLGAAALRFSADELRELNTAVAAIPVRGERLPEMVMRMSGVEAPVRR